MSKAEEFIKCRDSGMTYKQIADQHGMTRQGVHCAIRQHNTKFHIKPSAVVYTGLRNWMNENKVSISELDRLTGCSLRYALKHNAIDSVKALKIMKVTKLSFNELFEETD